jgi:hypothetical protein
MSFSFSRRYGGTVDRPPNPGIAHSPSRRKYNNNKNWRQHSTAGYHALHFAGGIAAKRTLSRCGQDKSFPGGAEGVAPARAYAHTPLVYRDMRVRGIFSNNAICMTICRTSFEIVNFRRENYTIIDDVWRLANYITTGANVKTFPDPWFFPRELRISIPPFAWDSSKAPNFPAAFSGTIVRKTWRYY